LITAVTTAPGSLLLRLSATIWLHAEREQ
jgi:hypothetical protein